MSTLLLAITITAGIWTSVRLIQVRALGQRLAPVRAMNRSKQLPTTKG